MKKNKRSHLNSSLGLALTYVIMAAVCAYLNLKDGRINDPVGLFISVVMFGIVLIIFAGAGKCIKRVERITGELNSAAEKIDNDHWSEQKYLWDLYKKDDINGLFTKGELSKAYKDFLNEMKRLESVSDAGYKCNIEDYINRDIIEDKAKKILLNLIPGAMTGMGILGTFIGLSFGLQNFNTGTASEISSSIAPLMNGIKVAFHTSIYGMVFSLAFNLIYKSVMEHAYRGLDEFLAVFHLYVCPDPENDNISKLLDAQKKQSEAVSNPIAEAVQAMNVNISQMLELQKQQFEELKNIPLQIEKSMGQKLEEIVVPRFVKMNESFDHFAEKISDTQLEGISGLIDRFTSNMNDSMTESFHNLSGIITDTCELQKQNNDYMQNILNKVGTMTTDIQKINELSAGTVESLSKYVHDMDTLQSVINENFEKVNAKMDLNLEQEEKLQGYIADLTEYENRISESAERFSKEIAIQLENLNRMGMEASDRTEKSFEFLADKSNEYSEKFTETAKQQLQKVLEFTEQANNEQSGQIEKITEQAEKQSRMLTELVKQQISELVNFTKDTSTDMENAARQLGEISKELNGKLQKSLENTFDVFDEELAKITKHLSGTIAEIDGTTERVPKVVASAYEEMDQSFGQLQKQMETMVHALEIMQRNMPTFWDKLERDE